VRAATAAGVLVTAALVTGTFVMGAVETGVLARGAVRSAGVLPPGSPEDLPARVKG
jgi:hypothetical protein